MTETVIVPIILGVIASGGLWTLIQYLISRKDSKNDTLKSIKDKVDEIEKNMIKNERDTLRTQMIVMIALHPGEKSEILELAKHYFVDLKGNWFATPIFNKWCEKQNIEPEWFSKGE